MLSPQLTQSELSSVCDGCAGSLCPGSHNTEDGSKRHLGGGLELLPHPPRGPSTPPTGPATQGHLQRYQGLSPAYPPVPLAVPPHTDLSQESRTRLGSTVPPAAMTTRLGSVPQDGHCQFPPEAESLDIAKRSRPKASAQQRWRGRRQGGGTMTPRNRTQGGCGWTAKHKV